MKIAHLYYLTFICISSFVCIDSFAQQTNTLPQLLLVAEKNYPLLKSKMLDIQASQKGVNISKSLLIPALDASYQMNYATHNNITGMSYPQFMLPISGPPSTGNDMNGVFGSAASLLLNWQPLTFGQRKAQVDYSKAGLDYANADAENEIFQHKVKVINAYLDWLTATELVKVYQNNLKRSEANLQSVQSLVISGIRPGADTALFKAEVAKAKVELLNNRKYSEQTRIYLSQLIATDSIAPFADSLFFVKFPLQISTSEPGKNPLLSLYNSNVAIGLARKKVIARTALPTLGMWATTYARGSGILYNGTINSTEGLGLQRFNYGLGLQLSIPILQSLRIRPQIQQQNFLIQSVQERLSEIQLQLKKQDELADTSLNNAFAVANEIPIFLESARFSYQAMQSRYQSGLANISDLMQSQYTLVKSETDFKLAYISVWKAFLFKAAVKGDINLFINQVN